MKSATASLKSASSSPALKKSINFFIVIVVLLLLFVFIYYIYMWVVSRMTVEKPKEKPKEKKVTFANEVIQPNKTA
jgi:cytochrome bd-type quinol oxidase subunit 2